LLAFILFSFVPHFACGLRADCETPGDICGAAGRERKEGKHPFPGGSTLMRGRQQGIHPGNHWKRAKKPHGVAPSAGEGRFMAKMR